MPPDPGKQTPTEQAPKCPAPHCPSECSPEPQGQEEGETTWVSPDQPSQGDRPAACLSPSDCRPGPIPPTFWDRPEGPCWLFPSPANSPGRRLVPVCREMAASLSSLLCSPGCGFPYGDGRKGPPNPPGASSADRLLLQRPRPGLRHPEKKLAQACTTGSPRLFRPCAETWSHVGGAGVALTTVACACMR